MTEKSSTECKHLPHVEVVLVALDRVEAFARHQSVVLPDFLRLAVVNLVQSRLHLLDQVLRRQIDLVDRQLKQVVQHPGQKFCQEA